ncbi:hypothetical protein [Acetomicrobium sp.]|uniref:hypothetical protein n=1 Tax=Acetomicrobium sp. TaxID=1872099 RepID=UPI003D97D5B7
MITTKIRRALTLSWGNWRFGADFGSYDSKWEPVGNPMQLIDMRMIINDFI